MRFVIRPWVALVTLLLIGGSGVGPAADVWDKGGPHGPEATLRRGKAYAHLMRAQFAARRGEVGRAVDEIRDALGLVPDSPELHTEAAQLLLQWTGRVGEAERLARQALELDPEHPGATRFLAEVAAARALSPEGDEASRLEALGLYERLAAGDTTGQPELLQMLVELRERGGDLEGAVRDARRLVEERPGDVRATHRLARLLVRSGKEMDALGVLLEYVVDHPAHDELLGWVDQLANSRQAWPAVVAFLDERAPFSKDAPEINRFHGEALLRVGRMDSAAVALERALEARPLDPRSQQFLGLAYREMGRMAEAADLFRELADQRPDYANLHRLLAETLTAQQDVQGALRAYRAALSALNERREDASANSRDAIRLKIAALQLSQGRYAEAGLALQELELPEGPETLQLRCRMAIERRAWDEARSLARRLAETEEPALAVLLEGEIALREGKRARAGSRFEEAIELLGPYARLSAAGLYREVGDPERGLGLLRDWATEDPDAADARFHLGAYLYELNRMEEAERELREALRLDPEHDQALNFLGYSLAERKIRLEEALELIERALRVDAWNGAYLDSLGWAYYQMGRFELALPPLERAARELPRDPTILEHLGDVYHALGDVEGALTAWHQALESGAANPEALGVKIRQAGTANDPRASVEPSLR